MSTPRVIPLTSTMTVGGSAGKSTYYLTIPTDITAGDFCTVVGTFSGNTAPTVTDGWDLAASTPVAGATMQQLVWTRSLTAADAGGQFTVTFPSGQRGLLVAILDADTDGSPIVSTSVVGATAVSTATGSAVTPVKANSRVRVLLSGRGNGAGLTATVTPDSGWSEITESATTSTTLANFLTQVSDLPTTGTSSVPAPTLTFAGTTAQWATTTLIYEPVTTSPTVKWRAPGTLRFGLYVAPKVALLPLTVRGLWDGAMLRPAHLTVPAAGKVAGATTPGGGPDATPYGFASSGLAGGGFQNVIAQSPSTTPDGSRLLIVGADVAGAHLCFDGGVTWTPSNVGMDTHVAAVQFHPTNAGEVVVLTDSGLRRSVDWGRTWRKQAIGATAAANGSSGTSIDKVEHPRQTGNLLAHSADGTTLWVAGLNGLRMTQDNGATAAWTVMAADHIRGIAWDDFNQLLYVAVHNTSVTGGGDPTRNGVWKVPAATGTTAPTPSRVGTWPGGTRGAEELYFDTVSKLLYVVAHDSGCFAWNGSTWLTKNGDQTGASSTTWPANGLDVGNSIAYESVTGRRDSSNRLVLYVGGAGLSGRARGRRMIWRSVDAGTTWQCITDATNAPTVSSLNYGTSTQAYISQLSYHNFANQTWVAAQLVIDQDDIDKLYVAGRGGVWIGKRDSSTGKWTWAPSTTGLMVTVNMTVSCHPRDPAKVLIGSMDYTLNQSTDAGVTFSPASVIGNAKMPDGSALPSGATPSTGDASAYDSWPKSSGPVAAVVGASLRGSPTISPLNGVYFSPDPHAANPAWTFLQFPTSLDAWVPASSGQAAGAYDVAGVCLHRSAAGGQYVVLAAVTNAGVYRITGDGSTWNTWVPVTDFPSGTGRNVACFEGVPGSQTIYAHAAGAVWRSDSAGTPGSWVKLLTSSTDYAIYNSIARDPTDKTRLFVARSGAGVYRLDNASTSTGTTTTSVTQMWAGNPGPISMRPDGVLFAATRSGGLLRFNTPSSSVTADATTSTNVANSFFRDNATSIRGMDVGKDGFLYTADNGQGAIVGFTPA